MGKQELETPKLLWEQLYVFFTCYLVVLRLQILHFNKLEKSKLNRLALFFSPHLSISYFLCKPRSQLEKSPHCFVLLHLRVPPKRKRGGGGGGDKSGSSRWFNPFFKDKTEVIAHETRNIILCPISFTIATSYLSTVIPRAPILGSITDCLFRPCGLMWEGSQRIHIYRA